MTVSSTGTLDTNVVNSNIASLTLTTENWITLFVVAKTGAHLNHRVILEVSPDSGTTWQPLPPSIQGVGCLPHSEAVVVTDVRAKVDEAEGATSTVTIHILAR